MSTIVNLKISVSLKIHRVCVNTHRYIAHICMDILCLLYAHTEKHTTLAFLLMSSLYTSVNWRRRKDTRKIFQCWKIRPSHSTQCSKNRKPLVHLRSSTPSLFLNLRSCTTLFCFAHNIGINFFPKSSFLLKATGFAVTRTSYGPMSLETAMLRNIIFCLF